MLKFDPSQRLDADLLLENQIFDSVRNKMQELDSPRQINVPN